jgi:hypothetical protein
MGNGRSMEKTLEDIRTLLRENILPRLDTLDAEMNDLREVTWPVCQGQRDTSAGGPFANLNAKAYFLKFLHIDDIRRLLRRKAIVMGICPTVAEEELRQILIVR